MAESDPAQRRRVHDLSDGVAYAFEHASRTRVVEQRLLVADQELAELQIDLLDVGADAEDVRRDLADRGHLFAQSRGVRVRQGKGASHDGTITTDAPDLVWGTDGTRVQTAEEGMCWVFTAVDHYSCEVVGRHVCKRGDRFAALQPVAQGLAKHFGGVDADAGRGLSLRMDNGTQYVSEHFRNQVRFWGVEASYAFIEQPQTNGVAERFFRTLKEQIIYGRIYRTVAELREAVETFIDLYNEHWLPEKNGYLSPSATRAAWYASRGTEVAA